MFKFKNKIFIILILCVILQFIFITNYIYADEDDDEELNDIELQEILETTTIPVKEPILNSKAVIIYDRTTKKVIWGKNENERRAMASTTKILTSIVVLENSNLNDIVTISKKAANTGGSRLKINADDKISVNDLLYGLMLRSGNDAAVALAEHVGGSIEGFADLMNKKATELGLTNSHFVTPHGLDDDEHYTTAYELALITDYALNIPKFKEIVGTKSCNISINGIARSIFNTNELLGNMNGVDGVKTGFTGNAMRCLVASCTRDGNQIITIVLGADTKKDRTKDSISLINYIYNNFESINIKEKILSEFNNWKLCNNASFNVEKGISNNLNIVLEDLNFEYLPIKRSEFDNCCIYIYCDNNFQAPLQKDSIIGYLTVSINDKNIISLNILNNSTIEKMDTKAFLFNMIQNYTYCLESIFFR